MRDLNTTTVSRMGANIIFTLEQFCKKVRAIRFVERTQVTAQFSHTRQCGVTYFVYVCIDTLEVINPYAKKHTGRKYVTFRSSNYPDSAKKEAYEYIKKNT